MQVFTQEKTKSAAIEQTQSKTASVSNVAQPSFGMLLNDAIQSRSYVKLDEATYVMTIDDLANASSNLQTVFGMKNAFGEKMAEGFQQSSDDPKTAWETVKSFGSKVWAKGKDFLNWANKTLTSAMSENVSKKHIMDVYSALSANNYVTASMALAHYSRTNRKALANGKQLENATKGVFSKGYIENQDNGGWDKIKYGYSNLEDAGCGIFATFNVMRAVTGTTPTADDLLDIINAYEKNGNIAGGMFGTSPKAIRNYLNKQGYTVETINDYDDAKLNSIGNFYKGFITLKLNDKADITAGGHYESIIKEAKFSIHNGSNMGPHSSMPKTIDVINSDNAMVFCILAVNKAIKK